uniref:Fortilin binding protein n=1 Tax=Penaeus monodon TaxID=6687 RepID=D3JU56_PENMO|nr:fortilin binding protein [Penaeus monodon]
MKFSCKVCLLGFCALVIICAGGEATSPPGPFRCPWRPPCKKCRPRVCPAIACPKYEDVCPPCKPPTCPPCPPPPPCNCPTPVCPPCPYSKGKK